MSLGSVLSIASSGLNAIQGQIAVVSQNVANASSPGYTEEVAANTALVAGGQGAGVSLGAATRVTAPVLQASLYAQNASVSAQSVLNEAFSAIASVEGSTASDTGSTGSLTSLLSNLQAGLTTLQSDPSSDAQQQSVLQYAQSLASGINSLASTYATRRQAASDAVESGVASVNHELATIGSLSSQIVTLRATGQSTAGLEDQRSAAMTQLSGELNVRFSEQPSGAMTVTTASGTMLPTGAISGPLRYTSNAVLPSDTYTGTGAPIASITLDGQDVTPSMTGGALGANIQLRDDKLPQYTAELDSFAATLSQRLNLTGLPLFTDGSGAVPSNAAAPPTGFSSNIQVSVQAPALLVAVNANLIGNVDEYAFGSDSAGGTPWPSVDADPRVRYGSSGTLFDFASRLIASQGLDARNAQSNLADETAVQTALNGQISSVSSVSIDSEMSKMVALQNSYQANAKVVTAVQSMFTALISAVGTA